MCVFWVGVTWWVTRDMWVATSSAIVEATPPISADALVSGGSRQLQAWGRADSRRTDQPVNASGPMQPPTAAVRAGRSATSAGAVAEYSPYSV